MGIIMKETVELIIIACFAVLIVLAEIIYTCITKGYEWVKKL